MSERTTNSSFDKKVVLLFECLHNLTLHAAETKLVTFWVDPGLRTRVAEEVGVEPTRRRLSISTALKAARLTGDDTLPQFITVQSRSSFKQ